MKKLHPGAKWLFRIQMFVGLLVLIIFVMVASMFIGLFFGSGIFMFIIFLSYIVTLVIVSEVYARMSYNRFFYEFEASNLKIERGIIWKKYSYVPYERVQNVDIHRGIIARACGFSSVKVQTAGYSGTAIIEGYLPAVEPKEAEKIRKLLMKKIKGKRQGL